MQKEALKMQNLVQNQFTECLVISNDNKRDKDDTKIKLNYLLNKYLICICTEFDIVSGLLVSTIFFLFGRSKKFLHQSHNNRQTNDKLCVIE